MTLLPAPERGAPLDVGEEEGHGAAGEIGHGPLQMFGWTWCCPIVAREHWDQGGS